MTPTVAAFLVACGLLAVGLVLRVWVGVLRLLYIPAAVVGGLVGFALVQMGRRIDQTAAFTQDIAGVLSGWPGPLIAVVFAGLLLERSGASFGEALRRGARSGVLAWIIILGQLAIGCVVVALTMRGPGVPTSAAQLLEVSWAGGHGTAAAMGDVYESLGFAAGRDLAFFLATAGLISGVLGGLVLVNVAVRRGWTSKKVADASTRAEPPASTQASPGARAWVGSEVIEPLAVQVLVLAAAFATGYALQQAFVALADLVASQQTMRYLGNVPLFLFTLLGGWIVREALHALRLGGVIDGPSIQRLLGVAMEFLIVSAIATMRVESLTAYALPIALLIVLAAAWSVFCLLVLAPRLLPRAYWFELGLLNFGFSTANTPQGFMLLRIVDPELKSGAAEDYAVAAPLSAPFIGGGVLTFAVLPWALEEAGPIVVAGGLVALIGSLYAAGRSAARERPAQ